MTKHVELDANKVLDLFAELNSKKQKKAYSSALRMSAKMLERATEKQLRKSIDVAADSRNRWNGRSLTDGIRSSVYKDGMRASVHIMGDFRLKFFEEGTKIRKVIGNKGRRKGANRGRMKAIHFFDKAKKAEEKKVFKTMERALMQAIIKTAK